VLIKLIGATLKYETQGMENFDKIADENKTPIMTFWHNRIFKATHYFRNRGIVVITSQSFDGEYIARFIQRFGYGAVRGSSTRGGVGALVEMNRLSKKGMPMGFSIDGPKGPKYVSKSVACVLEKKTGNPVLPFMVETEKYFEIKSWDRMQIPKPFSRAKVFVAEPIYIEKNADEAEIENKRLELQEKLDELVRLGEQWRESISK
jgi:lysophospholipid acyltransferase (LPLAT)-like uncharacterized protein